MHRKKRTHDDFVNDMYDINPNIKIKGKYIDTKTPVLCECKIDGYEWSPDPGNLLYNHSGCPVCAGNIVIKGYNDLWTTHPQIAKMLKNKNEGYEVSYGNNSKKRKFICPECGEEIEKTVLAVTYFGLSCPRCSDGYSYPEKYFFELLSQSNINFTFQASFEWLKNKYYDFYIEDKNCIIETHGAQHYKESYSHLGGKTLKEELENDKLKYETAIKNGISTYICIDCRLSTSKWLKEHIIQSGVLDFLNISQDKVDWDKCEKAALKSKTLIACEKWNNGHSIIDIAKDMKLHRATVLSYIKKCSKIGLCNYDAQEEKELNKINCSKKIICLNTLCTYDSISDLSRNTGISTSTISKCCKGEMKSILIDDKRLVFKYYEEYLKMTDDEIKDEIYNRCENNGHHIGSKIICLNNNMVFASESLALNWLMVKSKGHLIQQCCRGAIPFAYKNKNTGEQFVWMYKDDYDKLSKTDIDNRLKNGVEHSSSGIKIICRNTNDIFKSCKEAGEWCGLKNTNTITKCCNGKANYAGKHPITKEPLTWQYYKDYLESTTSSEVSA